MPLTMPTSPFALSRRSSGTSNVTSVGNAIMRILPAITANIETRMNSQSETLATSAPRMAGSSI